jgi:hypothetical protein
MPNARNMASLSRTSSDVNREGTAKRRESATSSARDDSVASRSRSAIRAAAKRRGPNALPASDVARTSIG